MKIALENNITLKNPYGRYFFGLGRYNKIIKTVR